MIYITMNETKASKTNTPTTIRHRAFSGCLSCYLAGYFLMCFLKMNLLFTREKTVAREINYYISSGLFKLLNKSQCCNCLCFSLEACPGLFSDILTTPAPCRLRERKQFISTESLMSPPVRRTLDPVTVSHSHPLNLEKPFWKLDYH